MQRRAFLGTLGATVVGGCAGNDGSETDPTATPTPTPSTSTNGGRGSAAFEFVGVQAPDSVQLNVPESFTVTVRNVGSADGTFTSPIRIKIGDAEWRTAGELSVSVPAGETREWQSARFVPRYLDPIRFRIVAFDEQWSTQVTPRTLGFGDSYNVPTGLRFSLLGGSFETAASTATNGTSTAAPDGEKWAVMRLEVRNRLQEPQDTPAASTFVLEVNGERRPQFQAVSDDPYEGTELDERTIRRGDLVYAVPTGTQASDLTCWWEASLSNGDVKVIWTA
ncbi:hypothetical protein [Haloplanus natans]|uniref:hypothetical protein n=1 Tax=Haloplanus natans TaxID=376171 RepID=UPI000677DAE0|nr:hypothetical protein [Haloplanus natans]